MYLDSYTLGVVVILISVLLSVCGLMIVRRMVDHEALAADHDVAGNLLSVVGTMYAVLLGLIVVDAMSKFQQAQQNVQQEANSVADIFLWSNQLEPAKKQEIQQLCVEYVKVVLEDEWNTMDNARHSRPARKTAVQLIKAVAGIEPRNEREQSLYQMIGQQATQMWDNRNYRITTAVIGLPLVEWIVLIIGGITTVVFTYFFGLQNFKAQMVMTGMVALLIALNLYLVLLFGYPFSGDLKVSPRGFKVDQAIFYDQLGLSQPDTQIK